MATEAEEFEALVTSIRATLDSLERLPYPLVQQAARGVRGLLSLFERQHALLAQANQCLIDMVEIAREVEALVRCDHRTSRDVVSPGAGPVLPFCPLCGARRVETRSGVEWRRPALVQGLHDGWHGTGAPKGGN